MPLDARDQPRDQADHADSANSTVHGVVTGVTPNKGSELLLNRNAPRRIAVAGLFRRWLFAHGEEARQQASVVGLT